MLRQVTLRLSLLALVCVPGAAAGIEPTTWSLVAMGGLGGSSDATPDPGYGNTALQLRGSLTGDGGSRLFVRVGAVEFGEEAIGAFSEADLQWVTVGGEYRFPSGWFESGLFLGLGGYRLEGDRLGVDDDQASWGVTLGSTAEWRLSRHWSFDLELAGHWADLDDAQIFLVGLAGVGFHF